MATIIAMFISLATLTATPDTTYSGESDASTTTTENSVVGGDTLGW